MSTKQIATAYYLYGRVTVEEVMQFSKTLAELTDVYKGDHVGLTDVVVEINASYIPITSVTTLRTRLIALREVMVAKGYDLYMINTGLCAGYLTAIWLTGSKCGYFDNAVFELGLPKDEEFEVNKTSSFIADVIRDGLRPYYEGHFNENQPEGVNIVPANGGSLLSVFDPAIFPQE